MRSLIIAVFALSAVGCSHIWEKATPEQIAQVAADDESAKADPPWFKGDPYPYPYLYPPYHHRSCDRGHKR